MDDATRREALEHIYHIEAALAEMSADLKEARLAAMQRRELFRRQDSRQH
jgi:hypothetical protein